MTPEPQIQKPPQKKYTVPEFAARIRARYPSPKYDQMSDDELTMRMVKKHPVYKDHIDFGTEADAIAAVARTGQQADRATGKLLTAHNDLMSAAGKSLNPAVTPGSDYFRPLTATEQAAQKRGEPVIISEAGQPAPAAPQTAPSTSLGTRPPVSLGPVIQSHLEQIQRQQRQRELQAKVEQARQVRQRLPKGMLLAPGQQNQPNYQPKFGGGQPYREVPKVDLSVGNTAEMLAPTTKPGLTFEQDRAARAAAKEAKRPLQGIGDLRRYDEQQTKDEARIKSQLRAQVLKEEAEREAAAASGTEAQLLAQRARQEGMNPPDIEGQVEERYQSYLRSVAPEMVEQRKVFGELSPAVRSVAAPVARGIGGLMKTAGGIAGLGGLTENDFSRWANTRGAFVEESASLAPLNQQGETIVRGLPEQAVAAATDLGLSISQLVLLKKATGLPLGRLMALETVLKTSDAPLKKRAKQVAQSYAMGSVLDQHLGRLASATLFGAQPGLQNLAAYKEGNMTLEDALLQTGIQAGAGFILGGKGAKQLPKEAIDYTLKSPLTPEPIKDVVADVVKYGKGLVRSEDGRNLSLYADPQTGNIIGSEITAEQAKKYDPTIVTGEKRPVRSAKEISAEEYDTLAQTLGIETKTPAKQLPGEVKRPEPRVEKPVSSTAPIVEPKEVKPAPRPKEAVSSRVAESPGIQENITETITTRPLSKTANKISAIPTLAKTPDIIPELSRVEPVKAETEVIPRPVVPAVEPAVTPPAEVKNQPSATESQLTTVKEVTDEIEVAEARSPITVAAPGQATVPDKLIADISPRSEEPKTGNAKLGATPAQSVSPKQTAQEPLQLNENPASAKVDKAAVNEPSAHLRPKATVTERLTDWGSRLKTIAQAKDLGQLQALSDEMAAHKDDPRVARLRTSIQDSLAKARQVEIPEPPTSQVSGQKLSPAAQKTLKQAETPEGKTVRPAPTHRIGAPKLDTQRNSLEQQVRAYGGVKDDADQAYKGELRWLSESGKRGTVNQTGGMTAEKLATSLAQDGYGKGVWWEDNPNNVDPQKFLQAVMDDTRGQKHYSSERDAIEDDPDVKAWDTLTETDTGKELIERVQSGHARASDIVQFVREASAHGLSDPAIDAFVDGLQRTVQEELSGGTEEGEGYSLNEEGNLLDPEGTVPFAREFQLGLPAEGLTQQESSKPKTTDQRGALIRAQQERDEATDPGRVAGLRKLAEIRRRGMTVDEYSRQGSMFEAAPSAEEIKLLKDLERQQPPPESGQSSMFARGEGEGSSFGVEGNRVALGPEGARLLSDAYRQAGILAKKAPGITGIFKKPELRGVFERNPEGLARELDKMATKGQKGAAEFAEAVRQAAEAGDGKVVIHATESAKKHELFHEASSKAEQTLKERHSDLDSLTENDTFSKMYRRLTALGYDKLNMPALVEEAAAHIAEGRYDQLGIIRDEAVEWMFKWFKSFEAKNPNVNPRQFQEMSDEATKARDEVYAQGAQSEPLNDEAIPSVQAGREGGDRESIAAARGEEGGYTYHIETELVGEPNRGTKSPERQGDPHTALQSLDIVAKAVMGSYSQSERVVRFTMGSLTGNPNGASYDIYSPTPDSRRSGKPEDGRLVARVTVRATPNDPDIAAARESDITQTKAFKRWFGESKVVDKKGEPLVVYHRSPFKFEAFDPSRIHHFGFHFGTRRQAQQVNLRSDRGRMYDAYLSIQNPLRLPDLGTWSHDAIVSQLKKRNLITEDQADAVNEAWDPRKELREILKTQGYDGVIYENDAERVLVDRKRDIYADSYIAFDPPQIKSASKNVGTFDPHDPNILMARSDDPWADLIELSEEFGRLANEPEPSDKEIKQSRLAAGVEAKAIEAKLTAGFQGLPEYETVKVADQARMASELLRNDPQEARRVAMGQSMPSDNLLPESVFVAVENDALQRGDVDLLRELATASSLSREATGMGQRIRMLAERNPYSPVTAMKEVAKAREARAKKKMGPKFRERVVTEIKTAVRKSAPKAKDWKSFLAEIQCK